MYAWTYNLFSHKDFCPKLELSEPTVVDWCNFYRDICTDYYERHSIILGGQDKVVEIDETCSGKESTMWTEEFLKSKFVEATTSRTKKAS